MTACPQPGIYPGIPSATYRAWDAVNYSLLWKLKRWSPMHAKWEREHPSKPTPDQFFGDLVHTRLLEPAAWDERYAVRPECDRRKKEGKKLYAAFLTSRGNREEVQAADVEKILGVEEAIRAAMCEGLVKDGQHEVCIVWDDPQTGTRMKARLDCVHKDIWSDNGFFDAIVDVKTTASARDEDFEFSIYKYGYFMQAAIYCAGWEALTGNTPQYTILAVEKNPPFVPSDFPLGPKTLDAGTIAFRQTLHRYLECERTGYWPGYRDKNEKRTFFDMSDWHLGMEGVSRFQEHAELLSASAPSEPAYTVGEEPETQDEFDEFMK